MFALTKTFGVSAKVAGLIYAALVAGGALKGTLTVAGAVAAAAITGVGAILLAIVAAVGLSTIKAQTKKGKSSFIAW